jgi:hypothetical protein
MAKAKPYPRLSESQQELFWSKIKIGEKDACWPWQRALKGRGYGALTVNKQSLSAHRVAYILTFGPAPEDLFVFQECGRNECCNPAHLTTGTMGDAAKIEKKPFIDPKDQKMLLPTEERFWSRVNKRRKTQCWHWTSDMGSHGYGRLSLGDGRRMKAHRYSWELHNGPIPKGLCILHKCDNPPCVNPGHLFAGSQLDNIADMVEKKRHRIGEKNPNAVLNEAKVKVIKRLLSEGVKNKDIAVRMGVTRSLISAIKNGKRWGHVK